MITAAQSKSPSMAGLLANVSTLRVLCRRGNLSKPVTLRATDSGEQNACRSFATGMFEFKDTLEASFVSSTRDGRHTWSKEFCESIKKGLMSHVIPVYGYNAPAKSGAGIGVPESLQATYDAPCVFFCVVNSVHLFFCVAGIILAAHKIMVGWMGAERSAPVSCNAGYANPVQSTTSEIGVSGGGFQTQLQEAAIMATTPTQSPQFNSPTTDIADRPYLLDELTYETECVLAILRTINDVSDPHTKSHLVDAAELIGTQLLKKLEHNARLEDGDCE